MSSPDSDQANVHVLRRAGALEPELQNQPALQDDGLAERDHHPCQEAIEDEELASAREVGAGVRRGLEPILERAFERGGRLVRAPLHVVLASAARLSAVAAARGTMPRAAACSMACSTRSGATLAAMQSASVRRGAVTRTGPTHARSSLATSAWCRTTPRGTRRRRGRQDSGRVM